VVDPQAAGHLSFATLLAASPMFRKRHLGAVRFGFDGGWPLYWAFNDRLGLQFKARMILAVMRPALPLCSISTQSVRSTGATFGSNVQVERPYDAAILPARVPDVSRTRAADDYVSRSALTEVRCPANRGRLSAHRRKIWGCRMDL
jgi:hypothetical protein